MDEKSLYEKHLYEKSRTKPESWHRSVTQRTVSTTKNYDSPQLFVPDSLRA